MNDFGTFFVILISVTIFYIYLENKASDVTYINRGGVEYLVRNLPDKEEAALLLSKIRSRLTKIVESVSSEIDNDNTNKKSKMNGNKDVKKDEDKDKDKGDDDDNSKEDSSEEANSEEYLERQESFKRLKKNYKPNNITESSPGNKYTSYSINKGEKIVFCLRAKDGSNKLEDINTLMFVAIHELAHLMTKSIGHTTEFWDNMRFLLERGIEVGVYKKHDYNKEPVDYCGTKITDTPLNT